MELCLTNKQTYYVCVRGITANSKRIKVYCYTNIPPKHIIHRNCNQKSCDIKYTNHTNWDGQQKIMWLACVFVIACSLENSCSLTTNTSNCAFICVVKVTVHTWAIPCEVLKLTLSIYIVCSELMYRSKYNLLRNNSVRHSNAVTLLFLRLILSK